MFDSADNPLGLFSLVLLDRGELVLAAPARKERYLSIVRLESQGKAKGSTTMLALGQEPTLLRLDPSAEKLACCFADGKAVFLYDTRTGKLFKEVRLKVASV